MNIDNMTNLRDAAILVVGAGSIGQRHIRNLQLLGFRNIAASDTNSDQCTIVSKGLNIECYENYETALKDVSPRIVFICTPPVHHVSQALRALEVNAHIFIEKPISHTTEGVNILIQYAQKQKRVIQVGYNLRFHPGLRLVKQCLDENLVGDFLWGRIEVGQYLPDWRPWQDYRNSYTARRELGGGIILDASHEIDYALWMLGIPVDLICMAGKVSKLDVNVEDCATILLRFANNTQIDIHLDFVQRSYTRNCKFAGELGTIEWEYSSNTVLVRTGEITNSLDYEFNPNDMYVAELKHFFHCIGTGAEPIATVSEAMQALRVAVASIQSAKEHRGIHLG
jgi:predicted dehydrogenase